jgi:hypothetical protein
MNWAVSWIFLCTAAVLMPTNAYGYGELQQGWRSYLHLDDDWRAQCRSLYTQCKNLNWGSKKGWDCHACLRNCEGQQEWPFHLCGPSIKPTKPKPPPKKRRR